MNTNIKYLLLFIIILALLSLCNGIKESFYSDFDKRYRMSPDNVKWNNSEKIWHDNYTNKKYRYRRNYPYYDIYPDLLDNELVHPLLSPVNNNILFTPDINYNNAWIVKSKGFSDIYNYEDTGGLENYYRTHLYNNSANSNISNFINGTKIFNSEEISKVFPTDIIHNNIKYSLLGIASNPYYSQYYLIFEYEVPSNPKNIYLKDELKYSNFKTYQYILVQTQNDQLKVIHAFTQRNKININDIVYLSLGSFELGPLSITEIKK
jgi:hypothetical protein